MLVKSENDENKIYESILNAKTSLKLYWTYRHIGDYELNHEHQETYWMLVGDTQPIYKNQMYLLRAEPFLKDDKCKQQLPQLSVSVEQFCGIGGRLGNQLCQVSTLLAACIRWNCKYYLYQAHYPESYKDTVFCKIDSIYTCPPPITHRQIEHGHQSIQLYYEENAHFEGYFQDGNYFENEWESIEGYFNFIPNVSLLTLIKSTLNKSMSIYCVHIRRGDYTLLGWQLPLKYYHRSTQMVKEATNNQVQFAIFADDETWAKQHFCEYENTFIVPQQTEEISSVLWVMSKLDGYIVSNSTFGWWGMWLGTHQIQERKVIQKPVYLPAGWIRSSYPYNKGLFKPSYTVVEF